MNVNDKQYLKRVYDLVKDIPRGRVMTYGQIAIVLGEGYTARTVGHVMHGSEEGVPWQRVINSQGKCSTSKLSIPMDLQQSMLEQEGVVFSPKGKCDLEKYQWWPNGFETEMTRSHFSNNLAANYANFTNGFFRLQSKAVSIN